MISYKFRGKQYKTGEWLEGDLIHYRHDVMILPLEADWFDFVPRKDNPFRLPSDKFVVDPATVGQFTGLHDKNGKEIYEGDVIRINLTDGSTTGSSVFWNNRRGYWGCDIDINHGVQLGLIDKVRIEVIGNIHDNPELMKGGEQ